MIKKCDYCHKDFSRKIFYKNKFGKYFCSHDHQLKYFKNSLIIFNKERMCKKGSDHYNYKSFLIKCENCNKDFLISPSRLKRAKYCSKKCMIENIKRTGKLAGKNCNFYIHGRGRLRDEKQGYPQDWDIISMNIRKRDTFKCQSLSCKGKQKRKLEVHHIDVNTRNNNHMNLITLCRECHHLIHREIKHGNLNNINFRKTNESNQKNDN